MKLLAQSLPEIKIDKIDVKYSKTDDKLDIKYYITLQLVEGDKINDEFFVGKDNKSKLAVIYGAYKLNALEEPTLKFGTDAKKSIIINIDKLSPNLIQYLSTTGDSSIYVTIKDDIEIEVVGANNASKKLRLTSVEVNNKLKDFKLDDKIRDKVKTYLSSQYYYNNKFDFGVQPVSETNTTTTYFLSLKTQNAYQGVKDNKLYWGLDARLSTNFSDSLNYINYYPINYRFSSSNSFFNAKLGNESNQTFDSKRIAVDVDYTVMGPQLLNFLGSVDNRIRPLPQFNFGVKGYHNYSNDVKAFTSGQAFGSLHYYIPIFDRYSLIFDGKAFYDFAEEVNPSKKVMGNYSIVFGINLPKTGFTALFKFVDGKTDINYKQSQIIGLGLLMDFFSNKPNKTTTN